MILGALNDASKEELLRGLFTPAGVETIWKERPLSEPIKAVAARSFHSKAATQIRGTGYVVDSLEAALWAFDQSRSFEEGALMAVNLGDDADTTGAVYGQLAGAFYGGSDIPRRWLEKLYRRELIAGMADGLFSEKARRFTAA